MPPIVLIVAGAVLLLAGRKLFWLLIAISGFFVGVEVARDLLAEQPQWVIWAVAAAAGLVGAVVAMLFERVAFALAGFYASGYLALLVVQSLGLAAPDLFVFLVGGVIGAVIAALVMDTAIIVLSSLVGAAMIVATLSLAPLVEIAIAGALAAIGIVVQSKLIRGQSGKPLGGG